MQTRHYAVPATVLLALLLLWGCSKKPEQTGTTQNSDNRSSATQPATNGSAPSTNAPAANSAAGGSQQQAFSRPPLVIPAGTPITVRLQERLSSGSAVPGERFDAVIDEPVVVDNQVVVPVGALATGHVVVARHSGRL
jgi:hypothetical protein